MVYTLTDFEKEILCKLKLWRANKITGTHTIIINTHNNKTTFFN